MNTILLTWNPGPDNEHEWSPEEWEDALVRPCLEGGSTLTRWSVGNHVNNIGPGDTAYMYRQGDWERGIVARGTILTYPTAEPHWDEDRKNETTNYVQVEWQQAVPVSLSMEIEDLETLVPQFQWRKVYASGRRLPLGELKLADAWQQHVSDPRVRAYTELYLSDVWRNVTRVEIDAP